MIFVRLAYLFLYNRRHRKQFEGLMDVIVQCATGSLTNRGISFFSSFLFLFPLPLSFSTPSSSLFPFLLVLFLVLFSIPIPRSLLLPLTSSSSSSSFSFPFPIPLALSFPFPLALPLIASQLLSFLFSFLPIVFFEDFVLERVLRVHCATFMISAIHVNHIWKH